MMKHLLNIYIMCGLVVLLMSSCIKDEDLSYESFDVPVQLQNPVTGEGMQGIQVVMSTTLGNAWQATTDGAGWAHFTLPAGIYDLSASGLFTDTEGQEYVMNCSSSNIKVNAAAPIVGRGMVLSMVASRRGSLIINLPTMPMPTMATLMPKVGSPMPTRVLSQPSRPSGTSTTRCIWKAGRRL